MTTPKRSTQPRQRGPIGRKMWQGDLGMVYHFKSTAVREANGTLVEPVLVLSLDPANVERIRDEAIQVSVSITGFESQMDKQIVAEILHRLGLTPAKRRGKK